MPVTKTYFLVPHYDFPADGPVVLGSIIRDRINPGKSLNRNDRVYIPPEIQNNNHKYNWQHTIEHITDGRVSIWARCVNILLGLGGNFGGSFDSKTTEHFSFQDLETIDFSPTLEYIKEAVSKPGVKSFLEGSSYTVPVYMITGVKIVRGPGAQITSRKSKGREGHAHFGIPGIKPGYPFAVDAGDVSMQQESVDDTSFVGGSEFVIGYRLGKISFKRISKVFLVPEEEDFIDGAMLAADGPKRRAVDNSILPATVIYEGESAVVEGLIENEEIIAFDEEDEVDCRCIVVPSKNP